MECMCEKYFSCVRLVRGSWGHFFAAFPPDCPTRHLPLSATADSLALPDTLYILQLLFFTNCPSFSLNTALLLFSNLCSLRNRDNHSLAIYLFCLLSSNHNHPQPLDTQQHCTMTLQQSFELVAR